MRRLIIILVSVFSPLALRGQTLSLEDIFKVRDMDSVELQHFCSEREFKLKEKTEDNWIYSHSYYSPSDSSVWFIRTFPKDHSKYKFVYYYFSENKVRSEFKKRMNENGFKFKRTNINEYRGNKFTHNIYLAKETEIDLVVSEPLGQQKKYSLLYYKRIN